MKKTLVVFLAVITALSLCLLPACATRHHSTTGSTHSSSTSGSSSGASSGSSASSSADTSNTSSGSSSSTSDSTPSTSDKFASTYGNDYICVLGPGTYTLVSASDADGADISEIVVASLCIRDIVLKDNPATFVLYYFVNDTRNIIEGTLSFGSNQGDGSYIINIKGAEGESSSAFYYTNTDEVLLSPEDNLYLTLRFVEGSDIADESFGFNPCFFGPGIYEIVYAVDSSQTEISDKVSGWLYLDKTANKDTEPSYTLLYTYEDKKWAYTGKLAYIEFSDDSDVYYTGSSSNGTLAFWYFANIDNVLISLPDGFYLGCSFVSGSEETPMPSVPSVSDSSSADSITGNYKFGPGAYKVNAAYDGDNDVTNKVTTTLLLFGEAKKDSQPFFMLSYSYGKHDDLLAGKLSFKEVLDTGSYLYLASCDDGRSFTLAYHPDDDTFAFMPIEDLYISCSYPSLSSAQKPTGTYKLAAVMQGKSLIDLNGKTGACTISPIAGTNVLSITYRIEQTTVQGVLLYDEMIKKDLCGYILTGPDEMPKSDLFFYDSSKDQIIVRYTKDDLSLYFTKSGN